MNPYQPTHPPSPSPHEPKEDIRVQVTKTIWGCATGMMGISIPIMGVLRNVPEAPAIPIIIMACAAASTADGKQCARRKFACAQARMFLHRVKHFKARSKGIGAKSKTAAKTVGILQASL